MEGKYDNERVRRRLTPSELAAWIAIALQLICGAIAWGQLTASQKDLKDEMDQVRQDVREIRSTLYKK